MSDVPAWDQGLQRILNAAPVPDRKRQRDAPTPIPVTARLHLEHDGWQDLDTVAFGWTRTLARVLLDDARSQFRGVWIPAGDVCRRTTGRSVRLYIGGTNAIG